MRLKSNPLFSLGLALIVAVAEEPKTLPRFSSADSPTLVLIWGAVLLGGIVAFIAWGLTNAYPH